MSMFEGMVVRKELKKQRREERRYYVCLNQQNTKFETTSNASIPPTLFLPTQISDVALTAIQERSHNKAQIAASSVPCSNVAA